MAQNGKPFKIISLRECADDLGVTDRYMREVFGRTAFLPVFRIQQVAYYMRYDFDNWKDAFWEACTC